MDLYALLVFTGVYALAVASPGPAVAALIARGLMFGRAGALPFIAGLIVGDLVWLSLAALGLGTLAALYAPLFQIIKYAGAAYLVWMAVRIWRAPAHALDEAQAPADKGGWRAFFGALSLTLGNPKTMVFFLSIMPLVVDLSALTLAGFLEIAALVPLVMLPIFSAYVALSTQARRLFRSPRAMRLMHRGTAGMMAGTAALVASR